MLVSLSQSLQNQYYFLFQNSNLEYYLEFHIIIFVNIKESLERPQKHYMEMSHEESLYYEMLAKDGAILTLSLEKVMGSFHSSSTSHLKIWSTGVLWKKWKEYK